MLRLIQKRNPRSLKKLQIITKETKKRPLRGEKRRRTKIEIAKRRSKIKILIG